MLYSELLQRWIDNIGECEFVIFFTSDGEALKTADGEFFYTRGD